METKEYRTLDKSAWDRGEWDDEPDKVQWQDEATGLPCLIVRGPAGALCGYVGVAEGHPCFGVEYNDCKPVTPLEDGDEHYIDVHGGLTFSDFCADTNDESRHICHVPSPGEPDRVWWLGFDCNHSGDIGPAQLKWQRENGFDFEGRYGYSYRPIGYVRRQVQKLARQLAPASDRREKKS